MTTAHLPKAPDCPAWCSRTHPTDGWDIEQTMSGRVSDAFKECTHSLGAPNSVEGHDLEIVVDRWASAEPGSDVVHVEKSTVTIGNLVATMTPEQAEDFARRLVHAATMARGNL